MPPCPGFRIGDILIDMGACTQEDVDKALRTMGGLLGETLVEMGAITRSQLELALIRQKIDRGETGPEDMRKLVHDQSTQLFMELKAVNRAVNGLTLKMVKKNGA